VPSTAGIGERTETRERILAAAAELVAHGGVEAASTRAVAAAAGVQAPTLYRLFGDKQGLLDAVAARGFEEYLADKHTLLATDDPVEDLRAGWDLHVAFGLAHPGLYALMYGATGRPDASPAALEGAGKLREMLGRVARAGRLRLPVEAAAQLTHAIGVGVTLSLIATPESERDPELSPRARELALSAILAGSGDEEPERGERPLAAHALALRAAVEDEPGALGAAETALLREWLERLAAAPARPGS
jgi:AcrR family transcriptional regulator